MNEFDNQRYPGQDKYSLGICSDGNVIYDGQEYKYTHQLCFLILTKSSFTKLESYIEDPHDPLFFMGFRTWGLRVDIKMGTMCLVINGKDQKIAFGKGADMFSEQVQEWQA
jgi:hypothetical protein